MSVKEDRVCVMPVNRVIPSIDHFHTYCSSSDCSNFALYVQSPIKLNQDYHRFLFQFCIFSVRFSAYIVCPSVLSLGYVKLHKI